MLFSQQSISQNFLENSQVFTNFLSFFPLFESKNSINEANLILDGIGCATGWVSLALLYLQSDDTPMKTGKLTASEISWIGSIASLGAIVGNLLCEYIVRKFGTRHTIFFIGIPQLVGARAICLLYFSFRFFFRFFPRAFE